MTRITNDSDVIINNPSSVSDDVSDFKGDDLFSTFQSTPRHQEQPSYVVIDSDDGQQGPSFVHADLRVIDTNCGLCPICNQKFPFSVIEEHADKSLLRKETILSTASKETSPF